MVACCAIVGVITMVFGGDDVAYATSLSAPPDAALIAAESPVHPIFEEVVVCEYLITRLSEMTGVRFAANVSLAIRPTYHLYEGTAGVLAMLPIGIVFTLSFVKTRRIGPLILAHSALEWVSETMLASA